VSDTNKIGVFKLIRFKALLPFAVIGSEEEIEIDGQPIRARIYPWGYVDVDNPKHSDFSRLRSALLKYAVLLDSTFVFHSFLIESSHLGDLKSLTHDVLYETYRTEKLSRTVHADTAYVPNLL
jgi:cell division control protein 11